MSYVYNYVLLLGEDDDHYKHDGIAMLNKLICERRYENDGFIDASEHFHGSKCMEASVFVCGQNGVSPDEIVAMIEKVSWFEKNKIILLCKEQDVQWRLILPDSL